jgi:hypothetical protein
MTQKQDRNTSSVDPRVLAAMKDEMSFIASQQRGARRVKLERGENATVRFLPARLGPNGLWYARIARHWLNKIPITCPRLTCADFGGDIEADCPVCILADELNDDRDKDTSDFGWRAKANPTYLVYCVVFEKDGAKKSMDEILIPYEFPLQKSAWQELYRFYVSGGRKSPDSVLDYKTGTDFSVNRTHQGIRLYPLSPAPIFDLDQNFDAYIAKLEKALKNPKVQIPTTAQLEAFADKVQAEAMKFHRDRDDHDDDDNRSRSRSQHQEEDDGDLGPQKPYRAPAAGEDDGGADPNETAGLRGRKEAPDARSAHKPEPDNDVDSQAPPKGAPDAKLKAHDRLPLTEKRARALAESTSSPPERDDEEDNLPDDDRDMVSPAESAPARGKAAAEDDEKPTPVERKGASNPPETLQARVAKLKPRE